MLTRRQFLIGAGLTAVGGVSLGSRLITAGGGGGITAPAFSWQVSGAAATDASLAATFAAAAFTVEESSVTVEEGTMPAAGGTYQGLWTRDHAYVLWHYPELFTATQRRQFVAHRITSRTDGSTSDARGGPLPADFVADYITHTGSRVYRHATHGQYPIFDGIAFTILALWADWNLTADSSTFTTYQSAIDDCLAAIPRSVNGCVYSDPSDPTQDYGFTDSVRKTGDVTYGTALQAWAYKMLNEISGGGSSTAESETYANLRAHAEDGLATLRQGSGWYAGSSGNNAGVDDVWATALIVAEGLVGGTDRIASAQTIADAYADGADNGAGYESTISEFGLVRHLPAGQFWTLSDASAGTYQNGGYWLTPLWDCVRAVRLVNPSLALAWATEAMQQVADEFTAQGDWTEVPYEWHNYPGGVGALGYSASAAVVHRFV